ncbi:MAG: T9SS type A sorting domain-containing protein [Cyclobacteriaceae bacterium]
MKKLGQYLFAAFLLFNGSLLTLADPPAAPAGKVWILVKSMSDEFDQNSPDTEIWDIFGQKKSWDRTAAFDERIHEVWQEPGTDNYYLAMNPMWYYEDEQFSNSNGRTYLFAGGGMETRSQATYGYFEVRLRPSNFPMGSGVFMNSRKASSDDCNTKYNTELDIIENMGYNGPGFNEGFNNTMNVNSHAKPFELVDGSCQSLPFESTKSGVNSPTLEDPLGFNVVGMWWKNGQEAEFYYNNEAFGTITPKRNFNLPMPMIIVMETYTWGSDENNAGNPKPEAYMFEDEFRSKDERAVLYDWVRTWQLVDIDQNSFNAETDNIKLFDKSSPIYDVSSLNNSIIYAATGERTVVFSLLNESSEIISEKTYTTKTGVNSIDANLDFSDNLKKGSNYTLKAELMNNNEVLATDSYSFTVQERPLTTQLFSHKMPDRLPPTQTGYEVEIVYETASEMEIAIEVRDPNDKWIGGGLSTPVTGSGSYVFNVPVNTPTTPQTGYYFKAHMRPVGETWREAVFGLDNVPFVVADLISPILDITEADVKLSEDKHIIDVSFDYAIESNVSVDLLLLDSLNDLRAKKNRIERIGERSLTRSIFADSALSYADNYKVVIQMTSLEDQNQVLYDTLNDLKIGEPGAKVDALANDQVFSQKLNVFPNPSEGDLTIQYGGQYSEIKHIEILDLLGRSRMNITPKFENNDLLIDISDLASGTYILKVSTNNDAINVKIIRN